jgi:hypothetical protein
MPSANGPGLSGRAAARRCGSAGRVASLAQRIRARTVSCSVGTGGGGGSQGIYMARAAWGLSRNVCRSPRGLSQEATAESLSVTYMARAGALVSWTKA